MHNLFGGPLRYTDLKTGLPGIGSNVLTDRLRKLEVAGVVRRALGDVDDGVRYELTERGHGLGAAMAELRRWGADELLADTDADTPRVYDQSHAIPEQLALDEIYEWRIDGRRLTLIIAGQELSIRSGGSDAAVLVVEATMAFMHRWAAGETNWADGRANGDVTVAGSDAAWERMLVATNYPGRPPELTDKLLAEALD